jgi:hypothetical protein
MLSLLKQERGREGLLLHILRRFLIYDTCVAFYGRGIPLHRLFLPE